MSTVLCVGYVTFKVDVAHSTVLTCTRKWVRDNKQFQMSHAERHYTNALSAPSDVAFHRHHRRPLDSPWISQLHRQHEHSGGWL